MFRVLQQRVKSFVQVLICENKNGIVLLRQTDSRRFFCLSYVTKESATSANQGMNFFGFETVTDEEKRQKVQTVFTSVASRYDLMNDIMSAGTHRLWKDQFIHILNPTPGTKLLDVAGGTVKVENSKKGQIGVQWGGRGDIAFRFIQASSQNKLKYVKEKSLKVQDTDSITCENLCKELESHVIVLDMNEHMISICNERAKAAGLNKDITCVQGTAEALPFPDATFDAYTIAFGIRNVSLIDQALSEAFRVLRHGGRFLCLEFSRVENPVFSRLYDWYSMEIIPCIGHLIAGDWRSYQYLAESIQKFPNQEDFQYKIEDAGFQMVTYKNIFNGIAAIHSGYKL